MIVVIALVALRYPGVVRRCRQRNTETLALVPGLMPTPTPTSTPAAMNRELILHTGPALLALNRTVVADVF